MTNHLKLKQKQTVKKLQNEARMMITAWILILMICSNTKVIRQWRITLVNYLKFKLTNMSFYGRMEIVYE